MLRNSTVLPWMWTSCLLKIDKAYSRELLGWRTHTFPSVGLGVEVPEIPGSNRVLAEHNAEVSFPGSGGGLSSVVLESFKILIVRMCVYKYRCPWRSEASGLP